MTEQNATGKSPKKSARASLVDRILERTISRKLAVEILGTALLVYGIIDQSLWLTLTLVYLGVQGAVDAVKVWKSSDQ